MKLQVLPVGPPGPALYRDLRWARVAETVSAAFNFGKFKFFLLSDAVVLSLLFD
jgi:hypothetical protein